ncbi:MAG: ZIP family metal transporter [Pseudomonadota bacterium]|nr:ZIP family metal transporter [Gammaproteobacteria bacterium]MBU1628552.1 ZIP family metal transporter [Gammaproteobacteria bacterium]MBU1926616.1 ZIP family metal transporter [Gammaproteobacteria bacterium]MBU2546510.1 ZIP family metal transporter [Gammaproteobacteria bacterium]
MHYISLKLFASLIILFIALLGGLLPILLGKTNGSRRFLVYGDSFAGGIFLGAGLLHLLPDAHELFSQLWHTDYPLAFLVCALSIIFLRIIEDGIGGHFEELHTKHTWVAFLLAILLSIHSIIEGVALGVVQTITLFLVIFIAIIAHKGSAAFALGIKMQKSELNKSFIFYLMLIFALMTPVGILFGTIISSMLHARAGNIVEALFNAIAAGTFIYIAAFHCRESNDDQHCACCEEYEPPISAWIQLVCFSIGTILMAILAIWL